MSDTVSQIKDRLSIADVVGQYVKLERAGGNFRARCPFHSERTPSFMVSPARGTYHCFGCGVGGDMFTFIQAIEGIDFKGALKILADRAGVPLVFEKQDKRDERDTLFAILEDATVFFEQGMKKEPRAIDYLERRGLKKETVQSFRIGFAPDEWHALTTLLREKKYSDKMIEAAGLGKRGDKGVYDKFRSRIMFPIMDSAGRVVAFSGRIVGKDANNPEVAKYMNSPETALFHKSRILHGYDRAKLSIRKYNCTVLVEGQMDLVMSHQAGWTNTVAVSGTALTLEHIALLKRMSDNLVLALDADAAGIRAAGKSARLALESGMDVKVAELPQGVDPADLIKDKGPDAWKEAIKNAKHIISFLLDMLRHTHTDARKFAKSVETEVLPFIASIKSPVDRDHFVHEISGALGSSEETVYAALKALPVKEATEEAVIHSSQEGVSVKELEASPRLKLLFGVLAWQKTLPKPAVDIAAFEEKVHEMLGQERFEALSTIGESELESQRFAAEALYAESGNITQDIDLLFTTERRAQLQHELAQATAKLRLAEGRGDEATIQAVLETCKLLTGEIAKLGDAR